MYQIWVGIYSLFSTFSGYFHGLLILLMGFSSKNTEVVCHPLLQWTTFCQNSPPWPIHLWWLCTAWLSFTELDKAVVHVIRLRHYFANKGPSSQGYGFSSSHVWMWELDYKESWELKNWCFWTVVLEKTLESSLDCKEIQPVHPKGDQPWIFIGRTDVEGETPILWPPDAKSWLTGKDPDPGKDWRQEEKGTTGNEMVGWHHGLNGHEFG